jgi:hypothetical protein
MKIDIQDFVETYDAFQRNKGETMNMPRELQPLLIQTHTWTDISMDFTMELTRIGNKSVIMVVVNHISKYTHFCALSHPFTPSSISQDFMDRIFKLYGIPTSIVSDRDPTITNKFW